MPSTIADALAEETIKQRMGRRILCALEAKNWTQHDLAHALGISDHQVNRYVRGRVEPGPERLEQIAQLLDVSAEWIRFGDPRGAPKPAAA